jgi:hypothetical protein
MSAGISSRRSRAAMVDDLQAVMQILAERAG